MSYVKLSNFAHLEALWAVRMMDAAFGARLLSVHRFLAVTAIGLASFLIIAFPLLVPYNYMYWIILEINWRGYCLPLSIALVMLAISISFTRWFTFRVATMLGDRPHLN